MNTKKVFKTYELIQDNLLEIGDGYRAKNSELRGSGLPFVRASNVNNGFDLSIADRFPYENIKRVGRKISMVGDTVYTTKGTVGRAAYVKETTRKMVYSPQLSYWRSLDHSVLWPRYLFYWIQGPEFSLQANSIKGQTDMADYVSLTEQRRMLITVPPLLAQQAIASILGSLDDKIELNTKMNRTLETMARALYKSWFVDFDPVVSKAAGKRPYGMDEETAALFPDRFIDSELGPIPEGWSIGNLKSVTKFQSGYAFKSNQWRNEGIPVVRIGNVKPGFVDLGNTVNVEHSLLEFVSDYQLHEGDLIIGMTGNVGTVGLVPYAEQKPLLNQRVGRIITNTNELNQRPFLYFTLTDTNFYTSVGNRAHGSVQANISGEDIMTIPLIIPSTSLINTFNRKTKSNFKLLLSNHRENQFLSRLRDLLLPKLISGEIRIKDAEKVVEEVL